MPWLSRGAAMNASSRGARQKLIFVGTGGADGDGAPLPLMRGTLDGRDVFPLDDGEGKAEGWGTAVSTALGGGGTAVASGGAADGAAGAGSKRRPIGSRARKAAAASATTAPPMTIH